MRSRVLARWGVGAVALSLALTACGGDDDGEEAQSPNADSSTSAPADTGGGGGGGTASIEISEPQYIVPTNTNESSGSEVLDALFTGLIRYDAENKPVESDLAESVASDDQKVWTIKLKDGFTFHNGEPVNADSFIDAWNYGALNANGQNNNYFFGSIEGYADLNPEDPDPEDDVLPKAKATTLSGLKKVSDTEFTVTLSAPDNTFRTSLGYTAFYPMAKAALADVKGFEKQPIGNGPFQMDGQITPKQTIKVKKWADYKGTQPKLDGIEFKVFDNLDTALNELRAGNLDVMDSVPPSALAGAKDEFGDRYQNFPSSYYMFLGIPTTDAKYKDVNIRKAISMAIDRAAISKTIFNDTREPADAFVGKVVGGYREGACGEACTYDPAKAKQYLEQGGGLKDMTITYNADGGHKEWTEAACNQIEQNLGVQCIAQPKPSFDVLLDDLDKVKNKPSSNFGPFRLGWIMDYPSAQNYLGPLYSSNGSSNYYGYKNPEFDNLVKKGQSEETEEAAIADWQQAEDILARDLPAIPLFFGVTNAVNSEKVTNVKVDVFDHVDKINLSVK